MGLPVGRQRITLAEDEIFYAEVYGKETLIHTKGGEFRVRLPLRKVASLLSGGPFLQCFRSCIVNMEHIICAKEAAFLLDNKEQVPIALRNKEKIKEKYLNYRFEKMRRDNDE